MQQEFYYTFYAVFMRISVRYAPDKQEAEQWVHDGFLKAFQSLHLYGFKGSFEGWLKKLMVRVCLDNLRKQKALKNEITAQTFYKEIDVADSNDYGIENEVLQKYSFDNILILLNKLNEKQRWVFNLSVFEEYSHKEIAEQLGITENHSYWLLHQARKKLKEILTQTNLKKEVTNE